MSFKKQIVLAFTLFSVGVYGQDLYKDTLKITVQKAMGVPDIALSTGWDRNGSYVHDYNYIGVQFDLPIFKRNQGNIKSAKAMVEGSKYNPLTAQDQVKADVITAYANAVETDNIYAKFDKKFVSDLETLNQEMLKMQV